MCSVTDPCDESLFAECRTGRCVTGCTDPGECVAGSCDMSGAVGVCIEPISVGDADAGVPDASAVDASDPDASAPCPPTSDPSVRSLPMAVLGVEGGVDRGDPAWLETLGALPIPIDDAPSASFVVGARLEPEIELLAAVRGAAGQLTLRRGRPLESNLHLSVREDGALASAIGFGALATRSSAAGISFVGLRLRPSRSDDAFAWVYRQDDAPRPLSPMRTPVGTYPGHAALFLGPGDEELFAVRFWPETDPGGRLGIVGAGLGVGNATDIPLPAAWADRPVALSAAPSVLLVHEAVTRETRIVRVARIETAPVLDDDPLELTTDAPPAIVATPTAARHRVLALSEACGLVNGHVLACDPMGLDDCALSSADTAIPAASVTRVQASSFGRSAAVLLDDAAGARLVVLDEAGEAVELGSPLTLPATLDHDGASLRLVRTSLAAASSTTAAVVVVGGLYVDATEREARVRVAALGVTAP